MTARWLGRPRGRLSGNTVTSFAPSAPGAGRNAGITPRNRPGPPTSITVRSGWTTWPAENAASASAVASMSSSIDTSDRTSVSLSTRATGYLPGEADGQGSEGGGFGWGGQGPGLVP